MVEQNLNIIIVISVMILSIILASIMLWSYNKSIKVFISFYAFLVIIYSSIHILYILIKKDIYTENEYNITFGTSLFMALISFIIMIYFGINHIY